MSSRRFFLLLAGVAAAVSLACGGAHAQDRKVSVVVSFSILADLVANVGGDRVRVAMLVGRNRDAHVYAPTPTDVINTKHAELVVMNGLNFETWIGRLLRSSGTGARIVEAAQGIATIMGEERDHGDHSHAGEPDPHAWQSVANARIYVTNIRDGLIAVDPAGSPAYLANAAAYLAELDRLESYVQRALSGLPKERRQVIASHDAFGYYTQAYGVAFIAPQGVSTEAEASALDVANIIRQIQRQKISAVFLENISDPRLVRRIAEETGTRIGGTLYSDALSEPSGPAGTYVDMMRHNTDAIAAALRPAP